jgi:hypothetical protein
MAKDADNKTVYDCKLSELPNSRLRKIMNSKNHNINEKNKATRILLERVFQSNPGLLEE